MRRQVSLNEISDGKLYNLNDMVKADCGDCMGCSACCQGMGESIILDPLDVHRITEHIGLSFQTLLAGRIELHVVDGIILPSMKMDGERNCCTFLDGQGRCGIHPYRPGVCRLFPLGRYYENHSFQYFLQVHECPKKNKTKVKVQKWIDTPDIKRYERYITEWHYFLNDLQTLIEKSGEPEETAKKINLRILTEFYITPYECGQTFYDQFDKRLYEAGNYVARNYVEPLDLE